MTPPLPSRTAPGAWLIDRVNVFFRVRRYLKWVSERWFILAVCLVGAVGISVYRAISTPNIYRAASKIDISGKFQTPNLSQAQYMEELNSFYDRQVEQMQSERVLQQVYAQMRAQRPTNSNFELTHRAVKGPASFTMIVESTDFRYAKGFAATWAREFLEFKNEMRGTALGKTAASNREEIIKLDRNLEKVRKDMLDFQRLHNIVSVKELGLYSQQRLEQQEQAYQEIKTLRQRLENQDAEELASDGSIEQLQTQSDRGTVVNTKTESTSSADPLARFESTQYTSTKVNLALAESDLKQRAAVLKPAHPYMARLAMDVDRLRRELDAHLKIIEEKRLAKIQTLKRQEAAYEPIIAALRKEVADSREVAFQYEALANEETNIKSVLETLRRAEQTLNVTTTEEVTLNIIDEGVGSPVPVRPNRPKIILTGLFLGLASGLGLIYLLGRLDDRAELAEDVERELDLPILGQIPLVDLSETKQERVIITNLDKHNMFAEALRGVRSAVFFGLQHLRRKKVVLTVSSAAPGDGKTTITTNFAMTLAIAGHRVLLVDADLRRGNVHAYFQQPRENGFADVLAGRVHWHDVMRPTHLDTLHVISTGQLPSNPGELLVSPITGQFIDEAREAFDYVIFDCPPLTAIDDTFSLTGLSDGLLFVVMSGQTSMKFAKNAITAAQQRGAAVLGVILNGIKPNNPYQYYQQYYYTYYNANSGGPDAPSAPPASKMPAPKKRFNGNSETNSFVHQAS